MGALFEFESLTPEAPQLSLDQVVSAPIGTASYAVGVNKALLSSLIPHLQKSHQWHFPSFGQWSAQHTIEHILSLTGPAEVAITSWAISEKAIRAIVKLQQSGMITSLTGLFDERVKKYAPNGWQMADHSLNISLGKCHAKCYIIRNAEWSISIISSANLSENRRTECYVITEDPDIAGFHFGWITDMVNKRRATTVWN